MRAMSFTRQIISLLTFQLFFVSCSAEEKNENGGQQIIGMVVKVADADTITVLDAHKNQHKIRFMGIDAPERGQAYGAKATEALREAIGNKPVVVKVSDKDHYGRLIGRVIVEGKILNEWLVANGWAWHYKKYSKDAKLAELEIKAREARIGLWSDPNKPMAPWDYRSAKKQRQAVEKGDASVTGYWLNMSSNVRHNSICQYYRNTSKGRACGPKEGKACGKCGG